MKICLVLGKKLLEDGSVPDEMMLQLKKAETLYRSQQCDLIVIAGGVTRAGFDSEAEAGRRALPEDILGVTRIEMASKSTRQNIVNVKQLLRCFPVKSIVVVSSPAHTLRTRWLFRREWSEVAKRVTFDPVGTSSVKDYILHSIFLVLTILDPEEKVFLPIQAKLYKAG